jgi:branched-chain amino acid transport system substrate-binding protein
MDSTVNRLATKIGVTGGIDRRKLLKSGAAAIVAPAVLCVIPANAQSRGIKIGYVSPRTGPLAAFGEADNFILEQVRKIVGPGIVNNGRTYPVEIVVKDSQSNASRGSEVTSELILRDKVDLIVASGAPDTTNPVADQSEVNETPCITSVCPWQPYFFGRNGNPSKPFKWTYHFFWGLEDVIASYLSMWNSAQTNKVIGGLFPNDADGNAWGDAKLGFPPALAKAGYKLVDPGRYQVMNNDFSSQISAFKSAGCEIITGNMIPPDFSTFWVQCAQQGFRPKIVTIGKALLFPSVIQSLGPRADGLSTEIWWSPNHPFKSGLSGQTAHELCAAYTAATSRPWTQTLGYQHAILEVVIDVMKRTKKIGDAKSVLDALTSTSYPSIVGPIKWTGEPVQNVTKTPLVGGQWKRKSNGEFEPVITDNTTAPGIPVGGRFELLS